MPTSDRPRPALAPPPRGVGRVLRGLATLGLALAVSGCLQVGESLVDEELERVRGIKGFGVLMASPERTVIAAKGRRVVVDPARGSCIATDSVEIARRGAFLVVSDCVIEKTASLDVKLDANDEMVLPEAFPGVLTISIAGAPVDAGRTPADSETLRTLAAFLGTDKGRAQLGRGSDGRMVEIDELRTVDGTVYVLVHDKDEATLPLLSPRFWRAFIEVNERMVVATASGFREHPVSSDELLRKLALQVAALKIANGAPGDRALSIEQPAISPTPRPVEGELEDAEETADETPTKRAPFLSPDVPLPARAGSVPDIAAAVRAGPVTEVDVPVPGAAPEPDESDEPAAVEAGPNAPEKAPRAPARSRPTA